MLNRRAVLAVVLLGCSLIFGCLHVITSPYIAGDHECINQLAAYSKSGGPSAIARGDKETIRLKHASEMACAPNTKREYAIARAHNAALFIACGLFLAAVLTFFAGTLHRIIPSSKKN